MAGLSPKRPLLIIGGPTAAGKTALALDLAARFDDVALVSADAMQVYRGMDVGTAKPPAEVLARFPHACIDVRDPDQPFNVADFLDEVDRAAARAERVVVVGGTPFWLSALVRPLASLPAGDPVVRAALESLPDPHARLAEVDPDSAARLHAHDRVRVVRALEVFELTGRTLTELQAAGPARAVPPHRVLWLDRDDLRPRIGERLERMMAGGFEGRGPYLDEVRALLAAGFGTELKPMRSLGYAHLAEHLCAGLPLSEAVRRTERDTWRLARKQRSWARTMGWAPATADEIADAVAATLR